MIEMHFSNPDGDGVKAESGGDRCEEHKVGFMLPNSPANPLPTLVLGAEFRLPAGSPKCI